MPFGVWDQVDPSNYVLDEDPDPPPLEGAVLRWAYMGMLRQVLSNFFDLLLCYHSMCILNNFLS